MFFGFRIASPLEAESGVAKARKKFNLKVTKSKLGELYFYGRGLARDYAQACDWYRKAAAAGNPDAMYSLGWLYEHGKSVARDYTKARDWYKRAVDGGSTDAKQALPRLH